ncbi:hypothetical protein GCM10028810_71590 [Spirosoma litoris]
MWDTLLYVGLMGVSTYLYSINYRVLTPPLRLLTINITLTFATTLYAIYIIKATKDDNIYLYHILTIVQYSLYGLQFGQLDESSSRKRLIWLSIILFDIGALLLSLTIQPWTQYNSYAITIFNVLMALLSGHYLFRVFMDIKVLALERDAMFWIAAGLFFTSLGNFFVQGLMQHLISSSGPYALTVYWIHELMDCLLFAFFLRALYVYLRYSQNSNRP